MSIGRKSGIEVIGDVPWSTHIGLFYRTRQDLLDILVPYFKAGLENNEFCLWVTAEPLDADEARAQIARAIPDFDSYVERGQIEIIPYTEWYTKGGVFNADRELNRWVDKLRDAERRGFSGLRLTENKSWLERSAWQDFSDYERTVNDVVGRYKMIIVCSYPQDERDASDVLDVAGTHRFVLLKHNGEWRLIEDRGQKKAGKTLQSSEKFLNNVFDSIQDGFIVLDKDLNIIRMNHVLEAWLSDKMPLIGKKCHDAFHDLASPYEACPGLRAIKSGVTQSDIVPFNGDNGELKGWLEVFAYPLKDDDGSVTGVVEQVRDITGRRQAEEAIRKSEVHLARSQAIAHIGSFEWDTVHGEDEWSGELYRIFGVMPGEAKPSLEAFLSLIHPDDREVVKKHVENVLKNQKYIREYEIRIVRPDGAVRWIKVEYERPSDESGSPKRMLGTITDITDRKNAEDQLKEERQRFFTLLDGLPAFIYLQARDHSIRFANKNFRKTFGELQNRLCYEVIQCRDSPCPDCPTFNVFDTLRPQQWEWTIRTGNTYQIYDYPFKDIDGTPLVLVMGIDITERRQAEKELEEAKTRAELYVDLMGHDINNMNQAGMVFLELALQSPDIQKQDKELLLKSLGSLESSSRLIENVRKVQKVWSGELKCQEVDACRMILRAIAYYSSLPDIKASFKHELPICCPIIANDLAYEVFENIIGNAIKHGGQEPVIEVKFDAVTLDGKKYNKFTVEDNGPGIPDAMKEQIFNRRQRGNTNARGSGLGLYLVKSLVESYNGRVWVEDRVKGDHTKGSKFVVILPAL